MGCASCGQRYNRVRRPTSSHGPAVRRAQIAARRALVRKASKEGVAPVSSPDENQKREVFVQPDTPAGVIVTNPEIAVEPATGIPISVITGGEEPSKSLGDTLVKPITVVDGLGQGD